MLVLGIILFSRSESERATICSNVRKCRHNHRGGGTWRAWRARRRGELDLSDNVEVPGPQSVNPKYGCVVPDGQFQSDHLMQNDENPVTPANDFFFNKYKPAATMSGELGLSE